MDFYFIVLAVLFGLTNVFWAVVCFKLINRLMSRNFYEYKVAETVGKETKSNKSKQQPMYDQSEDLKALESIIPGF